MVMQLETGEFKWYVNYLLCLLKYIRPNGEIRTLSLKNAPKEPFLLIRHLPEQPDKAYFVSTAESTEDIFSDLFHYHVSYPSAAALCRGCGKQLDPRKLVVKTQLICIFFRNVSGVVSREKMRVS
jgi:hypothetical protein